VIDAYERAERCSAKVICICKMRSFCRGEKGGGFALVAAVN